MSLTLALESHFTTGYRRLASLTATVAGRQWFMIDANRYDFISMRWTQKPTSGAWLVRHWSAIAAGLSRAPKRCLSIATCKRRELRGTACRVSEPARVKDPNSAPLALNDRLLLQLPEQLVHGLATEREHHPEALLRDAHAA
jgi:hypothetical protein